MKKLFLFFVFCCFASGVSAQYVETVHLKNGGKIRGIITEQTPNQTLKIQTADGKVVVCAYDAIKKIETADGKVIVGSYDAIKSNTDGLPEQNLITASFRPHYEEGTASAQFIEVVHLKNGGMIRGIITEQIPNQSLKIQTADGSVFVYAYDEIEKITKEATARNYASRTLAAKNPLAALFRPHYEGSVDFGYSIGVSDFEETDRINISTSHGCRISPYLYAGVGFGFDYYHSLDGYGIPIFGDFRGYFTKSEVKPFLNFRIGYSVGDVKGLRFSPSIGVNYRKLDISFGYTYQKVDVYYDWDWDYYYDYYRDTANIGAITFKIGIRL